MAIEAVKVPTDIQVAEKIIGPITLKQVFLLVGTGAISFILWEAMDARDPIDIPLTLVAWSPLAIGAAFSFIHIHDVSLMRLLLLQIEKWHKPSRRTFGPRAGISITVRADPNQNKRKLMHKEETPKGHIENLSSTLDTTFQDIEEQEEQEVKLEDSKDKSETVTPRRPVKRERIKASNDEKSANIENIEPATDEDTELPAPRIMRDIQPPPPPAE